MAQNNDIKLMLILLVIVTLGIGYLLAQEGYIASEKTVMKDSKALQSTQSYVEVSGGQEVAKSNKVIISDKFVGDFSADGQVVVLDSTGSAFVVHNGVVLASNEVVIDARNKEFSVLRINEPAKSVSSN